MDAAGLKETARSGKKSAMTYPHPSFDLSSAFIPPSMKELYRWCLYLYMTHSEIKPIIKKKVAYVITPFIYETKNDDARTVWHDLLETVLNIKRAEMRALLDKNVYGIAYVSLYYPFERYLVCRKCKEKTPQKNVDWMYEDHSWVATCPKCKYHGVFDSESHPIRNRTRARFIHWRPQDMEIDQNPWTGRKRYIYRIPRYLIRKIEDPKRNKMLVEDTPDELLEAVRKKMNLKLDEDKVFTFEELSPSSEDDSFPIPPLLHVFKDTWLFQTLRRAQEAISVEHILPLTLLVPSTTTSGVGAHQNYDLYTWSSQMQSIVQKWRRDPNMIYTAPFPATVENIRGDAKALDVFNDMELLRQQIAGGLDVPLEFVTGGLNWSGGSISLRVLENLFLNTIEELTQFEQMFVIPNLRRFYRLPKIEIRHQKFKMADDVQQKQLALSLRQTNTVSDQTTREELDFDNDKELARISKEDEERMRKMWDGGIKNAKLQAETMKIQAEAQAIIQQKQMEQQAAQQQQQMAQQQPGAVDENGQPVPPPALPPPDPQAQPTETKPGIPPPALLNLMAEHFMKGTPDHLKEQELMAMDETNPPLVKQIRLRMKMMDNAQKAIKALPEQKPPRRGPGKAVI